MQPEISPPVPPEDSAKLLAELARPTDAYKRQAWLAAGSLALFFAAYLLLAGWFLRTAYRLTLGADSTAFSEGFVAGCALLLAVFMLKALFFVTRGKIEGSIEITARTQPRLFAFLRELADRAEAPRPHRVFLSPRVNAAVFYDLSPLNLILPSRKNLEIGLALVNSLSLSEFRAVLAHEFGHFTQRSMALMRWEYVAGQIATSLVARRDALDAFLTRLSRIDLRVAWIGWTLGIIVWSIRSLVETVFTEVMKLQRALSREMEFQADLVAVALTGSDELINALHRMQAADESWAATIAFANRQCAEEHIPVDLFALHSRMLEHISRIRDEPASGPVPPIPPGRLGQHRVFRADGAAPPQMWSTHPLNHEREENAKRRYVDAPSDARSAWVLFDDPGPLRAQLTAIMVTGPLKATTPLHVSLDALEKSLSAERFNPRYHGLYVERSVVRGAQRPGQLVDPVTLNWRVELEALYPESLSVDVARRRQLKLEFDQLRAIRSGSPRTTEAAIRFRGRVLSRKELPRALAEVEVELRDIDLRLQAADRKCRSTHLEAAAALGHGWDTYLKELLGVLHYADHTLADIEDLQGSLAHLVRLVSVTRHLSSAGRSRLIMAANDLHRALDRVAKASSQVSLDAALTDRLDGKSWTELVDKFDLPSATSANLGEWLKVIDGWVGQKLRWCTALRGAALDQLLVTEARVGEHIRIGTVPGQAPAQLAVPLDYDRLMEGGERPREVDLDLWERFRIADGFVPAAARLIVAASIVIAVLRFGGSLGTAMITIYNGLDMPVSVHVGSDHVSLGAGAWQALPVEPATTYRIETRTPHGEIIESFDAPVPGRSGAFVYNVAGASPLVEWTAVYGGGWQPPPRVLGTQRWARSGADVLFDAPPRSLPTSGGGTSRSVLSGMAEMAPSRQLDILLIETDRAQLIGVHARWDPTSTAHIHEWLAVAALKLPKFHQLLVERLAAAPRDVVLLREEQDAADSLSRPAVCDRHRAMSLAAPDEADLVYIATRCLPGEAARAVAFRAGHRRWPANGWFAQSDGYTTAENGGWLEAIPALDAARRTLPSMATYLAVDLARLHRMTEANPKPAVDSLVEGSEYLRNVVRMETGDSLGRTSPGQAYFELANADPDRAVAMASAGPVVEARILRLAGASDGASPALVNRAAALGPDSTLDDYACWAQLGLALRLGRDPKSYLDQLLRSNEATTRRIMHFLEQARAGTDRSAAEHSLYGLRLSEQGEAYSLAVIVLGAHAPAEWRRAAKALLFASERPYFR